MRALFRNLIRSRALALTTVVSLGLSLAFVIATLSILNGLLRHPYPYPNLNQLLLVRDSTPRDGAHQGRAIAAGDFLDVRRNVRAFSSLAGWRPQPLVITSAAADPERIEAAAVTASFFSTLGVVPLVGRMFAADADTPGRDDVVVLSRRLWNSRFGADPSVVGREIGLNGRRATVIGIIRDADCYPPGVDGWVPLVFSPSETEERAVQRVAAIARLHEAATAMEASTELASLSRLLAATYPLTNRGRGFELLPLQREQYEFTAPLFLFVLAAALLVLLLAAVNVSHLLVGRTLDRRTELSVRAMLGARPAQVTAIPIAEVVTLTAIATVTGASSAGVVLTPIRASLPEGIGRWVAGWTALRIDSAAVLAGLGVGAVVSIAIAAVVAVACMRVAGGSAASARVTRRATWSRRIIVAGEVSLAAALLLAASVMVAGFGRIATAFDALAPAQVLKFTLTLPESRYPDAARVAAFHRAMLDRVHALPDVVSAALVRNEPASNVPNPIVPFQREDAPPLSPGDMPKADVEAVSPAAFETLHLDVLAGRALADSDGVDAARVAVVSETAKRRFWPDRDPVGATIRLGDNQPVRIVGVVSDFILNWYDPQMRPVIFLPDAQSPARTTAVLVRTRGDPLSLARPLRAAVAELDDRQPLSGVESLTTTIADSLAPIRIIERMLMAGAIVAAALAALGIYAVLAQWVRARQRELGVRFALGATRLGIGRLVVREALLTASGGIVVGMTLTVVLIRLAAGALLGVPALGQRAALIVAASVVALTIGAALGPARRASRVDVAELLRLE